MIYLRSTTYGLGVMTSFTLFGFYSATYGPIDLWLSHTPSTLLDKQSTFGGRRYGSCHSRRHFTGGNWLFL